MRFVQCLVIVHTVAQAETSIADDLEVSFLQIDSPLAHAQDSRSFRQRLTTNRDQSSDAAVAYMESYFKRARQRLRHGDGMVLSTGVPIFIIGICLMAACVTR